MRDRSTKLRHEVSVYRMIEIKKDWYFMQKNNKYEVIYWNEDFTNREFVEVFCRRIDE